MPPNLLQDELAMRWRISPRTLERWRCAGQGPDFVKLGGRVLYRLADVEAFEQSQLKRAVRIRDVAARASQIPRRLTADPTHAKGQIAAHRQAQRTC